MAGSLSKSAQDYFHTMGALFEQVDCEKIDAYARMLIDAWENYKRVYAFGNGGSSFIASHHVCDYVKTASVDGCKRLKAFSLLDNMGLTTAVSNDLAYEDAFLYPLESYAVAGDIAVGISSSGNSRNVVKALEWARDNGLRTVALTGFSGGKTGPIAELHINVPSDNYGVIEDIHMCVGHIATHMLKRHVSGLQ